MGNWDALDNTGSESGIGPKYGITPTADCRCLRDHLVPFYSHHNTTQRTISPSIAQNDASKRQSNIAIIS